MNASVHDGLTDWTARVAGAVADLRAWIHESDIGEPALDEALARAVARLHELESDAAPVGPAERAAARATTRIACHEAVVRVCTACRAALRQRMDDVRARTAELGALRDKNYVLASRLLERARRENANLERAARRLTGLKNVLAKRRGTLGAIFAAEPVEQALGLVRRGVLEASGGEHAKLAMTGFCTGVSERVKTIAESIEETAAMVAEVYGAFRDQHALSLTPPRAPQADRYMRDLQGAQDICGQEFDLAFSSRFGRRGALSAAVDRLGARAIALAHVATAETSEWIDAVEAALDRHVAEQRARLQRRVDNLKRIHDAVAVLESEFAESEPLERQIGERLGLLGALEGSFESALAHGYPGDLATSRVVQPAGETDGSRQPVPAEHDGAGPA